MKTILALAWAASAGAVYWAPWPGTVDASAAAHPPAASSGEPATWMLVLVGAAVVAFIAARRY